MKLKVLASLSDDINNGWVWLPERVVSSRKTIRVLNKQSNKKVYCEALQIGKNYLERYAAQERTLDLDRDSSITMNEWYRAKLGISDTGKHVDLEIKVRNGVWGHIWASLHHPQTIVRLATKLAMLSLLLGLLSLAFGLWALGLET